MEATFNHNSILNQRYEGLMKKQEEEEVKCNKELQELLNKQEAAKQQHKARLFFFRVTRDRSNRDGQLTDTSHSLPALSGTPAEVGIGASEAAAQQLQGNHQELLSQERGNDLGEKQRK